MGYNTDTHIIIKEIKRKYTEMTLKQNNRQTYSVQTK